MTELKKLEYLERLELPIFQKIVIKLIRDKLSEHGSVSSVLNELSIDLMVEGVYKRLQKKAVEFFPRRKNDLKKVVKEAMEETGKEPEELILLRDKNDYFARSVGNQHALFVFALKRSVKKVELLLKTSCN